MILLLKKYMVIFLVWVAISFLGLMLYSFINNLILYNNSHLYISLIGGFIFSSILGITHYKRIKNIGLREPTKESLSTKQLIDVSSHLSKDDVIKRMEVFFEKELEKVSENTYEVDTFNQYAWSRTIVKISGSKEGTDISIFSSPVLRTTITDFSENFIRVRELKNLIS